MRKVKFRGWNGNEMRHGWGFFTNEKGVSYIVIDANDHYPEPVTLLQFTGARDKGGNDIYEGDILEDDFENAFGSLSRQRAPVIFCDDCYHFVMKGKVDNGIEKDHWSISADAVIVGNIYQNPERLK